MIEDIDLLTFEGFDSSVATSKKDIYVYFEGHFDTFSIEVINRPSVVSVLDYIYLNPHPKTEYKLNEPLNTVGGVIVKVYTDGKTDGLNLLNKYVYGFDSSTTGTKTLEVKIVENGILASTTYEIIVSE